MFDAFLQGVAETFSLEVLPLLFIGAAMGIIIGLLPGLGAVTAIAIMLPFIWKAPPEISLSLLIAVAPTAVMAGAITAILLNIPGEDVSVATLLDGYPMNQRGEGGRAIAAAVTASMLGGLISVALAFVMIPIVVPMIMAFGFSELFFLMALGMTFVAALTGRSVYKGLISAGIGIILSFIGFHTMTAVPRFTFGTLFLYNGLNLPIVLMGLFGLSEMLDLILSGQSTIAKVEEAKVKVSDILLGMKDTFTRWWLVTRSTVIGYVVGIIPAIGASVAIWVSYAQAKQSSKNPEKFGTGCVEGVIAPESACNAVTAGALLTTMVFGIPGSTLMAVLMGGFFMVGIPPGATLVKEHPDLIFVLLIGIVVANIFGGIICLASAKNAARLAYVSTDFVFPTVMVAIFVAAFITQNTILDFIVLIIAGILGLLMKKYNYSRAALCLGFVLGKLFEHYFLGSLKVFGPTFFLTPISIAIIIVIIGVFIYPKIRNRRRKHAN